MSYLLKAKSWVSQEKAAGSLDEQHDKINEVRELLGSLTAEMPSFLSESTIRRFLRAKSWSTEQATKALKETIKWRRQCRPDTICWEDIHEREHEARRAYIADYLDKNGRTVFISKPAIKSKLSSKDQIKHLVYNLEILAMLSENEQDECVAWLTDFQGLMAVAILSNPPKIFESFWKIVRHFLEPEMNQKVKFLYTNNPESHKTVADMFDLDNLETTFGGRNKVAFDMDKYNERMKRNDQMRGASKHANA
uniref:CRAL-TRIO domain-containing protein n=1 Tax=Leersia perrieri TaxID=77586 RepID=A0A0D9WEH4_9ORYZ